MARIVRKYGGSSLADVEKIRSVAKTIADMKWQGDEVVVVVSAMASTTDDLVNMAKSLNPDPPRRELDMLLSVGERISCSLLALAIEAEGVTATSFTGSQVGIITDTHHGEARIVDIRPIRLFDALEKDTVAVIAGFQGVSIEKEITTLGRGGSDATAVAIAAAINADRCELMKDVDGLYTAHPGIVKNATIIEAIDFDNALRMSYSGTVALQPEATRLAKRNNIPLGIGNSETGKIGTIVTNRPFDCGEITGISSIDGVKIEQNVGEVKDKNEIIRLFEHKNRWIMWKRDKDAPYSAVSIITSGRRVSGLHKLVSEVLDKQAIKSHGHFENPEEYWICIETIHTGTVIKALHEGCRASGWIQAGKNI